MCSPVHCACWLENASSHASEDKKVWVAGGDTLCTQAVKLTSPTPKKLAINESLRVLMLAPARYAIIGGTIKEKLEREKEFRNTGTSLLNKTK